MKSHNSLLSSAKTSTDKQERGFFKKAGFFILRLIERIKEIRFM